MVSSECLLWYCDLFTTETEELSFFHQLGRWPHFTLFLMLVWWHKSRYKINYSYFFRGDWRGVLQWCNVRAHKIIISACTIDFRPTLTYESTSADLQQQHLTSFCAVCGLILLQKGKHCGLFRGEGCNACDIYLFQLGGVFVCNLLWPNLVLWCTTMGQNVMQKKEDSIFKVKVTAQVYLNVDPVQTKLMQRIPPPFQITLKGEKKKKKKI